MAERQLGPLARRISILRWNANLSRPQLAERAGISVHLLQSLEQGRTANPKLQTLLNLARGLSVGIGDIISAIESDQA